MEAIIAIKILYRHFISLSVPEVSINDGCIDILLVFIFVLFIPWDNLSNIVGIFFISVCFISLIFRRENKETFILLVCSLTKYTELQMT